MPHLALIGLVLALTHTAAGADPAAGARPTSTVPGKTVWLVQPLYPGQELLVARTEDALRRLMAGSPGQVIGTRALADALQGRTADLRCLTGDVACADPVDAFVSSLGFERVVMLKGGQEDAAYRYKATSYVPGKGELASAEGSGAILERALLGALVKVAPLASAVEVGSTPLGATVFIDGEKVGITPFSGQILPGERVVKLELASHMPLEKKLDVPVRGRVELAETLEKIPARIQVTAAPAGTSIAIDGVTQGKDKVDKPIQPGRYTVALELAGYEPLSEQVEVQPGATFTLDRTLTATRWTSFKGVLSRSQEDIYGRGPSLQANYEWAVMHGNKLYARNDPTEDDDETLLARQLLDRSALHGLSLEYHQDGRYFGLMVVGAGYYSGSNWRYTLENGDATEQTGKPTLIVLRALQPHLRLAVWRLALYAQAGFELRGLLLQPSAGSSDTDYLWFVDVQTTAQVALRGYLFEGLFLEGMYRFGWAPFSDHAATRGFHVGIGYAF